MRISWSLVILTKLTITFMYLRSLLTNEDYINLKIPCLIARNLDTKKIGTEVFGELRNLVLEENGEDKMVRESNQ